MKVITEYLKFDSKGKTDIINITSDIASKLNETGIKSGIVTISVIGSTASITTVEFEPALVSDIKELFEKIIPSNVTYEHDATWGDANGYSHLRSSLLGTSITVPFVDKELVLGTWQQIIFLDFDNRPRSRKICLQFMGE
ncbi:MAG: secondary thiamine-phosphate synthase enzyme YjbQ [Candidatus Omnitrophota bacterium]